jgi:hypothetical protein
VNFAALPLYELFLFSAIYVEGDSCAGEHGDSEGDGALMTTAKLEGKRTSIVKVRDPIRMPSFLVGRFNTYRSVK